MTNTKTTEEKVLELKTQNYKDLIENNKGNEMKTETIYMTAWEPYEITGRPVEFVDAPSLEERFRNVKAELSKERRYIAWVERNHPEVYEEMIEWAESAKPSML